MGSNRNSNIEKWIFMLMHSEYMDNSRILKGAFLWPYIIITYYKQTAHVIILKSTQNKTNHFEIIMKSLYGLKLQQICAFICYDFRGLPLFVNYSNICHLLHTVIFTNLPPFLQIYLLYTTTRTSRMKW